MLIYGYEIIKFGLLIYEKYIIFRVLLKKLRKILAGIFSKLRTWRWHKATIVVISKKWANLSLYSRNPHLKLVFNFFRKNYRRFLAKFLF